MALTAGYAMHSSGFYGRVNNHLLQQSYSKIKPGKATRKIKMDNLYFWPLVSMK